jgi:hypothetical protein
LPRKVSDIHRSFTSSATAAAAALLLLATFATFAAFAAAAAAATFPVFPHKHQSSVQVGVRQVTNSSSCLSCCLVCNEPTSLGFPIGKEHHICMRDFASLAHVVLQVLPGYVPRKISDVDSVAAAAAAAASSLACTCTLAVFTDKNQAIPKLSISKLIDGRSGFTLVGVLNNCSSGRSTIRIGQYICELNFTGLAHVILQILPSHTPREIANKDPLLRTAGKSRRAFVASAFPLPARRVWSGSLATSCAAFSASRSHFPSLTAASFPTAFPTALSFATLAAGSALRRDLL